MTAGPPGIEAVVRAALAEGRTRLFEDEGYALLDSIGFQAPRHIVVAGADAISPAELEAFPGDRVVVKLRSARVAHRTEVGGVAIVPRLAADVAAAIRAMAAGSPDPSAHWLVSEFVPHRLEPGGELLLAVRWSAEFGPVATIAIGGEAAEALASILAPEERLAAFVAGMTGEAIEAALSRKRFAQLLAGAPRGRLDGASARDVAAAVAGLLRAGSAFMPDAITEIEINPLVFREGRPVPLDALVTLGPGRLGEERTFAGHPPFASGARGVSAAGRPAPLPEWRRAGIRSLLEPATIAIIGVSSRLNPGRIILRNILDSGFPASGVRVVKQDRAEIDGCACVPGIDALDPPADLLVVSVAAAQAADVLERAARGSHARSIILIPGGMGEREGTGERAAAVARGLTRSDGAGAPPVVNGGNCLGVRSVPGAYDTLFIPKRKLEFPRCPPHPVAVISQSGAFAIARTSGLPWLNPRFLITLGNQADLTVGEYLEHLVDDPAIRVFACYVEGFRPLDGLRFLEATRRIAAQGRAVILYRAGRSAAGASAMASHTASIAGEYAVTRELVVNAGALVADTIEEFDDLLTLATRLDGATVTGLRIGAMSNAGFECVAIADRLGPFTAAQLAEPTLRALDALLEGSGLGEIVAARNPLDVTPITTDAPFAEAARLVLADAGVDVAAVGCVPLTPALDTLHGKGTGPEGVAREGSVVKRLAALRSATDKAWIAVVDSGPAYDPMARALGDAGIPVFRRADRALAMFGRYAAWRRQCVREAQPGRP